MLRIVNLAGVLVLAVGAAHGAPAEQSPDDRAAAKTDESPIRVEHNPDTFITHVRIQATNNSLAWSDVVRGLARARGNDDTALEGILPDGRFDLTNNWWQVTRLGLNLALKPHVRFDVEQNAVQPNQPWLVITLDRAALLASVRRLKASLRTAWLQRRQTSRQFGLLPDDSWQKAPATRPLVVVVHGLDSSPERCEALIAAMRKEGLPCAAFRYPSNQPIEKSAKLLSDDLKKLAKAQPGRDVSLVTSSMGGLVARAAVEDPELDPGNVRRLIMVAPPNHGSALARFEFALDLWTHLLQNARRKEVGLFYAMIEDGMCEASGDLTPGSALLKKLNARPRNPKVQYTIILGTAGPLKAEDLAQLRESIAKAGQQNRWVRFFGSRVHKWLEDLDEVVEGKGDGCVSVARGRLEGVDDTVVLRISHLHDGTDVKKLHQEILLRLRRQ